MKNRDFNRVINAWIEASRDLKINVKTPFTIETDKGEIEYPILVENFGGNNGTIILDLNEMEKFPEPEKYGFYRSAVNPDLYIKYDRNLFIDTLEDWGYCGNKNERPNWFSGKYYQENK